MKKILIANRGEIAVRIMRTCREMGIGTVAVYSDADARMPHALFADERVSLGDGSVTETYLDQAKLLGAAQASGVDAIHPGYGFLSENAGFAAAVDQAGLIFVGPRAKTIGLMGLKREAKQLMADAGVPVIPGYSGTDQDVTTLRQAAESIGFPVLIKASAGGGGKGMRIARGAAGFENELETARREAQSAFGNPDVILEKYLEHPRHIEFQIFGDSHGNRVHLNERECSIQRRHQKIIEESPSPAVDPKLRQRMGQVAVTAADAVDYLNAGTVEFMLDREGHFYFLEMNTRLQVEHGVTELVTGKDLVRWQLLVADGGEIPAVQSDLTSRGHAIEARVYAEDPRQNFFPQTGRILRYDEPRGPGVRIDSGVAQGSEIGVLYDPMLAKLLAFGSNRLNAIEKMSQALSEYIVHGLVTNLGFLKQVIDHPVFRSGDVNTSTLDQHFIEHATDREQCLQAMALCLTAEGVAPASTNSRAEVKLDPWEKIGPWRAGE